MAESPFDFIVVGGGPAGSALAAGLAKVPSLKVLLLEAGGNNEDMSHKAAGNRYSTFMTAPDYNWKHESIPQPHMAARKLGYDAGKGLGGGTAINFGCYTRGPAQDYDAWAKITGDEQMGWKAALERLKDMETMHAPPEEIEKYCKPAVGAHGQNGPIQVSYDTLDQGVKDIVDRGRAFGYATNLDVNSGNVIGMGASLSSAVKGLRTTAANFLKKKPDNLTVRTHVYVTKIIMEGKKAIGVETADAEKVLAAREVILSASTLRSPHILLHSGIGPARILSSHSIPVVHDLPGVGQQLRDHCFTYITLAADPSIERDAHDLSEGALKQWLTDQTGPMAQICCPAAMAYLKTTGIEDSEEFKALDESQQAQVAEPGRPNWELLSNMPPFVPGLDAAKTHTFVIAFMNELSTGSVTLRSANPSDSPVIDPQFFSHPFDRRVAIETMKEALTFLDTLKSEYIVGPEGTDDEAIWKYVAANTISMWHPSSTVAMGAPDDPLTCLDTDFKVKGVEGLRVVDCSAIPLIISAHTQAPAYNVGAAGVQKILKNYRLDPLGEFENEHATSSVETKDSPAGAGEDKEPAGEGIDKPISNDAKDGPSHPTDGREHKTPKDEFHKTAKDQQGNLLVARRASTWSPFSGVASKLQRRFSTKPKGSSRITPLARSRTNEEGYKPLEEDDGVPMAAIDGVPQPANREEAPKEIEGEQHEPETPKLSRRFSMFRAVTLKRRASRVPKIPKSEAPKAPKVESLAIQETEPTQGTKARVAKLAQEETTEAANNEAIKENKEIDTQAQSTVLKAPKAETPKATKPPAPKAAKAPTPKARQAKVPKAGKPGIPKVTKQKVSLVSRNEIYKAMEASVPMASQAEAPKTTAVLAERPKVVKAQVALGSDDNDWCFLA